VWALLALAAIAADSPDRTRAEPLYREALDLAEQLGMRPLAARCRLELAGLNGRREPPGTA
jgi:hypothetical protein